jgi:hypothetical protein
MRFASAWLLACASCVPALDTVTVQSVPELASEQGLIPAVFSISRGSAQTDSLTVTNALSGTATKNVDFTLSGGTTTTTTIQCR